MWIGCQAQGIDKNNPDHYQEWFFPPWHHLYLYYFEQLVRDVLNDDSFSLPYWDPASGNEADLSLPSAFRESSSPLYDDTR
ncbi:MAG: tyrosinase family protein [Candidatus Binataceae bacterium]